MARKKTEEELKAETAVETGVETAAPTSETNESNENDGKNETSEVAETVAVDATDEAILKTLKLYADLDEAFVDAKGCVFTKDTPAHLVGKAVLYKNPYFNN